MAISTVNVGPSPSAGSFIIDANPIPSPNDTVVTAGSKAAITDSTGNRWTITSGDQVAYDHVAIAGTSGILEIAYAANTVWEDTSNGWYSMAVDDGKFSTGIGPLAALPLPPVGTPQVAPPAAPEVSLVTNSGSHVTISGGTVGTITIGNDTFSMLGSGIAAVALGTAGETLKFVGMSQVSVTGSSAVGTKDVVNADSGKNTFVASANAMEVTGGSGADTYIFQSGCGSLTIDDFSAAKGDSLLISANLHNSMVVKSDGDGGTLLSFSGAGSIDLRSVGTLPASGISFVAMDPGLPHHP